MSIKKKLLEYLVISVVLIIYTIFIVYISSIPIVTKMRGWATPSSGICLKNEGYTCIGDGEVVDFGDGMKVRFTFEQINGDVAQ